MATIGTGSTSYLNTPRISYISTQPFQDDIFQYKTSLDPRTFQTTGTLTPLSVVGTATADNCKANRVLRENGKKLYPSGLYVANDTTYSSPSPGVTTYMVGVYDPVSFLNGFIDPNSKVFAVYNTDKPEYVPRGINPNGSEVDQGPPVYTLGSVVAGQSVSAGTSITAGTVIGAGTALGFGGSGYIGPQSVTQLTNKGTSVTVNGPVVDITTSSANLNAHDQVSFTLNNTSITGATNTLLCIHTDTGVGKYIVYGKATGNGTATITIGNADSTNESQALVLRVVVLQS